MLATARWNTAAWTKIPRSDAPMRTKSPIVSAAPRFEKSRRETSV